MDIIGMNEIIELLTYPQGIAELANIIIHARDTTFKGNLADYTEQTGYNLGMN